VRSNRHRASEMALQVENTASPAAGGARTRLARRAQAHPAGSPMHLPLRAPDPGRVPPFRRLAALATVVAWLATTGTPASAAGEPPPEPPTTCTPEHLAGCHGTDHPTDGSPLVWCGPDDTCAGTPARPEPHAHRADGGHPTDRAAGPTRGASR
jgi:hypothetical protein